ncbi:ATP-dependent helicase [Serinicoccus marinus]|uniref:ATP-dependent helicase n=1 Tax=Serinicoccus marinus TaxID=247333 RepID=UPI002492BB45|nr:ATP-dependent helicase [Serinicoccus marinus]
MSTHSPGTLDATQEAVASAYPVTRQLVSAGPGAGKSHVVGALTARLVENHNLYPEEILVVSFSRAAVDVVRERTAHLEDEGERVEVSTLDSLAARLLAESGHEGEFRGYEQQIAAAHDALRDDPTLVEDYRHLVVDEAQDLVGVRARFVVALLDALPDDAGFTVLGDPLQALYDFQVTKEEPLTSEEFLGGVRERSATVEHALTGEYRARTPDIRRISAARPDLMTMKGDALLFAVEDLAADLAPLGSLDVDAADDLSRWSGTTALLCDTNARAALVVDRLADLGLRVELAAGLLDPGIAPWLATVLGTHPRTTIAHDDFVRGVQAADHPDPEAAWDDMLRLAPGSGRELNIRAVSRRLGLRAVPRSLMRERASPIVASTVHRAKGLEFDNVVLVDERHWTADGPESGARRLFVALSRARTRLTRATGVSVKGWSAHPREPSDTLWTRRAPGGRGHIGVLVEAKHCRALGPADHDLTGFVGHAVTWRETDDHIDAEGRSTPCWEALVDGTPVARTGVDFGAALSRLSYGGRRPTLQGGRVEGLETVVGAPRQHGPGSNGMWSGCRVVGALDLVWT